MTTALSKRHQARNERALQELVKTIPGNDRCADCGARNPGWASWSLGIFLCMRCASLHRKLGTHISKVKSLSMDSWSNDQVDSMRRNGNVNNNRTFNPQSTKPPIPLDVDEVDAVLEKFIKQKYDQQLFSGGHSRRPATRNDTGSTRSSEDQPPPLPPKPGKRFGFGLRSASSMLPLSRNAPASPPRSPHDSVNGFGSEPIRVNKQSRVFGASVGGGGGEMEAKLAQLTAMGFADEKRNASILKGMNGNLERALETLVRLGEGSAPTSRSRTPNQARNIAVSQPLPSLPSTAQNTGVVTGISFAANGATSAPSTELQGQQSYPSMDQSQAQANRSFSHSNPYQSQAQSYNPFGIPNEQPANVPLERAFSGMQISPQQQQPLFPNATGGYPSQPPPAQDTRFQTMTPPVPQMPQQYIQSSPYVQQNSAPNHSYNPFYQTTQQVLPPSTNPYASTPQIPDTQQSYNPFQQYQPPSIPQQHMNNYSTESPGAYSPQVQQDSFFQQTLPQQQNQHSHFKQQQFSSPFAPQHSMTDPSQYSAQAPPQQPQQFNPYQPQPLQPQQTGRIDKSSILALYNYPQLAPPPLPNDPSAAPSPEPSIANLSPGIKQGQRSVTMPVQLSSGSRNPFQSATGNANAANGIEPGGARHVSQESVNGRHSPDAFASLSARFVR
ncbi:hypothetical protein HO173_005910 [Letharia columbiana]|uniref:ArfGap-domain-containing protein n=1 Tax=Letharia columbiana TaxID=112416 RepID=A0A8H6L505_9LECA|nr:uncharacterized protein HO173_005910 [Letharia columbiana]KAF6235715.1 hypothetical protein HO173_005910 [Letharia columbiana]